MAERADQSSDEPTEPEPVVLTGIEVAHARMSADISEAKAAQASAERDEAVAQKKALEAAFAKIAREREGPIKPTSEIVDASAKDKHDEETQRWWLRYCVATVVIGTLWAELIGIFLIVLLQGFGGLHLPKWDLPPFKLNDWLIGVLVGGVLVQTIWCLQNIAAHLFPEGEKKMDSIPKPPGLSKGSE